MAATRSRVLCGPLCGAVARFRGVLNGVVRRSNAAHTHESPPFLGGFQNANLGKVAVESGCAESKSPDWVEYHSGGRDARRIGGYAIILLRIAPTIPTRPVPSRSRLDGSGVGAGIVVSIENEG